jgi:menaquinone-dependent protoporphyrinogen IX oxidase
MAKALIYATNLLTRSNVALAKYISKNANTDIFNLKDLMRLNLDAYDTIIFGTSNMNGKPDKLVQEFIETNKSVLSSKKTCLYVVCLKEDEKTDEQAKAVAQQLGFSEAFLIHKRGEATNESGFSSEVDAFIEKLR